MPDLYARKRHPVRITAVQPRGPLSPGCFVPECFSQELKITIFRIQFDEHRAKAGFHKGEQDLLPLELETNEHRVIQENVHAPEYKIRRHLVVFTAGVFHLPIDRLLCGILDDNRRTEPVDAPGNRSHVRKSSHAQLQKICFRGTCMTGGPACCIGYREKEELIMF